MTKNKMGEEKDFAKLLDNNNITVPKSGDTVKGIIVSASKSEIKLDIDGIFVGVIRGLELYDAKEDGASLKPGDEVEATVIEEENENGELELSLRYAGEEKAWANLREAFAERNIIKVKIVGANRGGLLASFSQINGFIPVSQLSPENYPRVSGGDKNKILEKLKLFVGNEIEVRVASLDEEKKEDKIIFSEKEVWNEKQKDIIAKHKIGSIIDGRITAVTDFGVFVGFGDNLEGLIHISELAWQRIDSPSDLFKIGDGIKAEIIGIDGVKIFLSAKKLMQDPWEGVEKKYKIGQKVKGEILKVNPFGLFVKLDEEIHGLAHISQMNLAETQKINEIFKAGEEKDFTIVSIEPKDHRLGLVVFSDSGDKEEKEEKKKEKKEKKEKKVLKKEGKPEKKEKKSKAKK
jgi:small subunit ribosomal protein S1